MTIDFTLNIGVMVQIVVLVLGGLYTVAVLMRTVASIKEGIAITKETNDERFDNIQSELKKIGDILVNMARFDERLIGFESKITNLDNRITTHSRKLDDLSRGQGFVRGARSSVDGEYP